MKLTLALTLLAATGTAVAQDAPLQDFGRVPGGGGMMMRADANNDGVITREEMIAQTNQRFDRLDANRDGKLTPDEMQRATMRMRRNPGGDMPVPPAPQQ